MKQILKRLEIIKNAISIEDEDIIKLQASKIKSLNIDSDIENILSLIENSDYEKVIELIDKYLTKYSGAMLYEDSEIQGLKLELKILEKRLQELNEEKSEYLNLINDFNAKYNLELGELIQQTLRLRKEILEEQADNDEESKAEYEEAKQDYEEFKEEHEEQIKDKPYELNKDELKEIKSSYRKACKLCHPDIVSGDVKKEAEEIFKDLNNAYAKKDLNKVKEIFDNLENGNGFRVLSDSINDKEMLKSKIADIKDKINEVSKEIKTITAEDTFRIVKDVDKWDDYINNTRKDLEIELKKLLALKKRKKD